MRFRPRNECIRAALESHPDVLEARAQIEKASAAVRLAKREYLPDIEAFAGYSYSDDVPFLARNFGTFGVHLGYDLGQSFRRAGSAPQRIPPRVRGTSESRLGASLTAGFGRSS